MTQERNHAMTKKTAAINDLSGMGRCSLVADISVLSAMGISVNPVPTAVLTAQTEYEGYYSRDCNADLPHYLSHWSSLHARFDGILTGYLADSSQTSFVREFLKQFKTGETTLLVDPVMGDDGFTYANFSPDLLRDMKALAEQADILTPNITELCLLTGTDPGKFLSSSDPMLPEQIGNLARSLLNKTGKTILVTGLSGAFCGLLSSGLSEERSIKSENRIRIVSTDNTDSKINDLPAADANIDLKTDDSPAAGSNTDFKFNDSPAAGSSPKIGNLLVNSSRETLYLFPHEKGHFSGTGDLFAAVVLGGRLSGWSWDRTVQTAGSFLSAGVHASVKAGTSFLDGIDYEKYLPMLTQDRFRLREAAEV